MERMAIAGPSTLVTDAAAQIVEEGGSVTDAAIVAALTAMCTEPGICAPGGGGFLTIDIPGHDPVVIDGYVAYPGLGFEGEPRLTEIWMEYGGGMTTLVGPGSIAVPGVFAGLELAHQMFGIAPWRTVMEAVASVLEDGFPMGRAAHNYLVYAGEPIFSDDPTARDALFDEGRPLEVGETVRFEGLASTIRYIGEQGARVLYDGDLGETIVSDLAARGGQLTRQDLHSYRPIARRPLSIELSDWDLHLNPSPAVGGVTVAVALSEIFRDDEDGPAVWAEALVKAFRTRQEELEASELAEETIESVLIRSGIRSPSTISISAADATGGAVAGTFSAGYGSGVAPAGTGLMMNNAVGEVELTPAGPRAVLKGRRMMSNMAPTVARSGENVVAVGTPGADRITSALVVTLTGLMKGLGLRDAIEHPRLHPEFGDWGIRIAHEPGLDLSGSHYQHRVFDSLHMFFGGVNGTGLEGGRLHAHADSRRVGSVLLLG